MGMNTTKKNGHTPAGTDFFEHFWEQSWTYIKTVVDVVREPVLILDKDLRVMAANESFYRTFQVEPSDTEKQIVYELGNGQWNIPALRKLLDDILPENTFFKGFEVSHDFPVIGHKVMMLNARRIHTTDEEGAKLFPPIILLAMEDITEIMSVAETLSGYTNHTQAEFGERTQKLEDQMEALKKEVQELKKKKE